MLTHECGAAACACRVTTSGFAGPASDACHFYTPALWVMPCLQWASSEKCVTSLQAADASDHCSDFAFAIVYVWNLVRDRALVLGYGLGFGLVWVRWVWVRSWVVWAQRLPDA